MVCTQNRIFLSLKKGRNTACYKGDEAWGCNAHWNTESVTKDEYCMILLRRSLEESNPCRQKEGGAGLGIYGFMDRISVWGRWDGSGGEDWWQLHSNTNELNVPELCTKKCCVLPPIFKSCRDSKGLSRNTAFLKQYPPPSPGIHYLQPVNTGVSQSLCANHIAVLWESFQQAVRGSVSTRAMLRAPPLCRCHLPISLPSLNPPPLFHSLRLFKHDAKYILKSWIH